MRHEDKKTGAEEDSTQGDTVLCVQAKQQCSADLEPWYQRNHSSRSTFFRSQPAEGAPAAPASPGGTCGGSDGLRRASDSGLVSRGDT